MKKTQENSPRITVFGAKGFFSAAKSDKAQEKKRRRQPEDAPDDDMDLRLGFHGGPAFQKTSDKTNKQFTI